MKSDSELLRQFAEERSEEAFNQLVNRYLNLVYSTALRSLNRDTHQAKDIVQSVFILVARKANALAGHPALAGWLYITTQNLAAKALRAERRRVAREQKAFAMQETEAADPISQWAEIRPVLDAAMQPLGKLDREVILRHFFAEQSFRDIGTVMNLSEDAVRMRIGRALDKIRTGLARRGVASTSIALSTVLTTQAVVAAPAGLSTAVSSAAIASAAGGGGSLFLFGFMSTTKVQMGVLGALIVAGLLTVVLQQQTRAQLQNELAAVRAQNAQLPFLRNETMQLARAPGDDQGGQDELVRLRAEADSLRSKLTAATTPESKPTLAPGMISLGAWEDAGTATPGAAFETMLWAKATVNAHALGKMLALAPADAGKLRDIFDRLPESVRLKLGLASADDLAGLACAMNEPIPGARFMGLGAPQAEGVTVRAQIQRENGRVEMRRLQFLQTDAGWEWVVPGRELEHGLNEIIRGFLPGYPAFEGTK
jgi:RNA polymerase sigma factor (sigma-70 family)